MSLDSHMKIIIVIFTRDIHQYLLSTLPPSKKMIYFFKITIVLTFSICEIDPNFIGRYFGPLIRLENTPLKEVTSAVTYFYCW